MYKSYDYIVQNAEDDGFIEAMERFGDRTGTYIEYIDHNRIYVEVHSRDEDALDRLLAPYLI